MSQITKHDDEMTPAQADLAHSAAEQLRQYERETKAAILRVGALLLRVKAELPHGAFQRWLRDDVGWHPRTAQNYMRAAGAFGDECETVSYLPARTIYALSAPEIRPKERQEVLDLIRDPAKPPTDDIARRLKVLQRTVARRKAKARPVKAAPVAKIDPKLARENAARAARKDRIDALCASLVATAPDLFAELADLMAQHIGAYAAQPFLDAVANLKAARDD